MNKFPSNARVCFIGDSITAANLFVSRVMEYYIKHYPEDKVRIFNSGISGATAEGLMKYLDDDVFCHEPTHVVIMTGVNDSARWLLANEGSPERYNILKDKYLSYEKNLRKLCDILEEKDIKITLCTPAPYDEYHITSQEAFKGGYALMLAYANYCRRLAGEKGYPLCDYHEYLTFKLETEVLYDDDHIHPNELGHYRMAECFLKSQGLTPDEFAPISDTLSALREYYSHLKDIYSAENNIIGVSNYSRSNEEKMQIIREKLLNNECDTDYLKQMAEGYLVNKIHQGEYVQAIKTLTEELMG